MDVMNKPGEATSCNGLGVSKLEQEARLEALHVSRWRQLRTGVEARGGKLEDRMETRIEVRMRMRMR